MSAFVAAALGALLCASPALSAVLTVTTTADDLTPNDGSVSLREAITAVNAGNDLGDPDITAQNPGTFGTNDTIRFDIPGSGQRKIAVGSAPSAANIPLPTIFKSVTIDGSSQPGFAGTPVIALSGEQAGGSADGLLLELSEAVGSTVEGLDVFGFSFAQIELAFITNATIAGNDVGFDTAGTQAVSPIGVYLVASTKNTIGGTTAAARNVISGNLQEGVLIHSTSSGNVVEGNFIGTDPLGEMAHGNALLSPIGVPDAAVHIFGDTNTIGGSVPGAGNVISGNADGVLVEGGQGNAIQGNFIGTDATGARALPNLGAGVEIADSTAPRAARDNTVGGTAAGAGNTIAFNAGPGVLVGAANDTVGNAILGNSIFSNDALGIDLGGDGVTPDTPGAHSGPNALQNFPVISSAQAGATATTVNGSLDSGPSATFRIELFVSPSCDPSGFGQGRTFIGFTTVATDAAGNASFAVTLPVVLAVGESVTATATDQSGDTSEYSACSTLTAPQAPGAGSPGTQSPTPQTPGTQAPAAVDVTRLAESAASWREGRTLARFARATRSPVGTTFSFQLNVAATVRLAFTQTTAGRLVAGRCVPHPGANRRQPRCPRTATPGALSFAAHAGADSVRFQGRISRTAKLKPGRYTLIVTATNAAGQRSVPRSLSFTIVKP